MEKPLFEFKNRLRNVVIIIYWIIIAISSLYFMTHSNLIHNTISLLVFGLIIYSLIDPLRLLKTYIYFDAIVFKERGFHPLIRNEYGIIFENIQNYKIKKVVFNLNWIIIQRRNGKTIRKLISLSEIELFEFSKMLKEKVKIDI